MTHDGLAIRSFGAGDEDALWAILEPMIRAGETYPLPRDWSRDETLAYWTAPEKTVLLAENAKSGDTWGTYYLRPNNQGGGAHVCNCGFVTAPAARGKGVAGAMCRHAMEHARKAGYRAMQFNFVVATNEGAIALWQRHGFEIVGRLPGAFDHPSHGEVDALVMYQHL